MPNISENNKKDQKLLCEFAYEMSKLLGSGAFGFTFSGHDTIKDRSIAWKRQPKSTKILGREIKILKELTGEPNCLEIFDYFLSFNRKTKMIQNIVTELGQCDLEKLIDNQTDEVLRFKPQDFKDIAQDLINGLNQMHSKNILHRDLKPENILKVKDSYKIADFGSGKLDFETDKVNTPYVVSRYYRAPELILGLGEYNTTIDIWSYGIILLELLLLKVPWKGRTEGQQLVEYFKSMGSPSEKTFSYWKKKASYDNEIWGYLKGYPKSESFWKMLFDIHQNDDLDDLIRKCLDFDDRTRITSSEAINHRYFNDK